MGTTYSAFYSSLDNAMRQSANLDKALKGYAFLNDNYQDSVLVEIPTVQLYTIYPSQFPNVSWAEGYANKLWEAFSRNPITRKFDPLYAAESVRDFVAPQLSIAENEGLRAYISKKYLYNLNSAQKEALLAAHAKWIKEHPAQEGSILAYLPGELWESTKKMASNPTSAIMDAIEGANRMFPVLMSGMRQWLVIGAIAFVAIQFGPMVIKKLSNGRS